MSNLNSLNLSRKWRSKNFDEIIGQDLVVRLVKNSLYRDLIFPVYLFSGPKGCGKTSMARLFSTALNCSELKNFQTAPQKVTLPCLECYSCKLMQRLGHPDFIEIDAASNTGVDNVRNIIDTASFVPVVGAKKIYLIDEAHMLSKAAFNAFLKILEEPPLNVVFMLATTDEHKIIETIKSRCFQLFFYPINSTDLIKHLTFLCEQESIIYDQEGLNLVAHVSEGSARDAINLIERIRLAYPAINKRSVYSTLGFIDDEKLLDLLEILLKNSIPEFLEFCKNNNLQQYSINTVWKNLVSIIHTSISVKLKIKVNTISSIEKRLNSLVQACSVDDLISMLDTFYSYENSFLKSSSPYLVLEMVLIKICQKKTINKAVIKNIELNNLNTKISTKAENNLENSKKVKISNSVSSSLNTKWQSFLNKIEDLNDPLLKSVFKQAIIKENTKSNSLEVTFSKDLIFFKDWLENTKKIWMPLFSEIFVNIEIVPNFTGNNNSTKKKDNLTNAQATQEIKETREIKQEFKSEAKKQIKPKVNLKSVQKLDISDVKKWPKANLIIKIFPGRLDCISQNSEVSQSIQKREDSNLTENTRSTKNLENL